MWDLNTIVYHVYIGWNVFCVCTVFVELKHHPCKSKSRCAISYHMFNFVFIYICIVLSIVSHFEFDLLFLTEGFKEAAEKFQAEAGVEPSISLNTLDNRILIREAVQSGRIQEATHLVNKLHPWLLDNDRYLYFHLQQLHLIELIR